MRVTSATAILALASSALAANYSCPAGSLNGTQFNNQSYAATPSQVLSIVGNFIDSDWQGLAQASSTGSGAVGSTRDVVYGPLTLVEELTSNNIYINDTGATITWNLTNGPLALTSSINVTAYFESLVVNEACNGSSSQVYWTVDYCYTSTGNADQSATISSIFSGAHTGGLANISSLLGNVSAATCGDNSSAVATASSAASSSVLVQPTASISIISTPSASATGSTGSTANNTSGAGSLAASAKAVGGAVLAAAGVLALL